MSAAAGVFSLQVFVFRKRREMRRNLAGLVGWLVALRSDGVDIGLGIVAVVAVMVAVAIVIAAGAA